MLDLGDRKKLRNNFVTLSFGEKAKNNYEVKKIQLTSRGSDNPCCTASYYVVVVYKCTGQLR